MRATRKQNDYIFYTVAGLLYLMVFISFSHPDFEFEMSSSSSVDLSWSE